MYWIQRTRDACFLLLCLSFTLQAEAITIDIDFATGTLFSPLDDAQAKATINAAADAVSDALTGSLNAITTDVYMGTNGSTTATFDWSFNYTDPSTGSLAVEETPSIAADTIKIFVGARSLSGSTLGVGGPGSVGWGINASGVPSQSPTAVDNAESASELALARGGGPRLGTADGTWNWNGYTDNYDVDYGISYGSVAFDNDASTDWHFNHATPVASGKNDLYSVAIHEILHAIGYGIADSWDDLVSGTTWNGAEVQAITGSGANLVHTDGSHVAFGVLSTSIVDGSVQEVSMDPNITTGTRKELTVLDLAFLRDIGFETITPSFPPDYDGDGDVDGADLAVMQNWYGINANGDADGDGDTDGADFLIWQRNYTGPLVASSASLVPEPSSLGLLLTALAIAKLRLRYS